jgi:hypothetical protein
MRKTTLGAFDPLRERDYDPDGETALYDMMGHILHKHEEPGTTYVIISDGKDTASKTETQESTTRTVRYAQSHEQCKFFFIGYGHEAQETGESLGLSSRDMFLTTTGNLGALISSQEVAIAFSQSQPEFVTQQDDGDDDVSPSQKRTKVE